MWSDQQLNDPPPETEIHETPTGPKRNFSQNRLEYLNISDFVPQVWPGMAINILTEGKKKCFIQLAKEDDFYEKLWDLLVARDFELPELNREKWTKWPMKMPVKKELVELKAKYPHMETGILTENEEKKLLEGFDTLLADLGFEVNIESRNEVMDRLLISRKGKFEKKRMKILVAAIISGQKLLETRLVIDCWKRLVRCSEKWNDGVSKLDKTDLFEKVEKEATTSNNSEIQEAKKVKNDFSKVRKDMGYRPCELRTMIMSDVYRKEKFKITNPISGKWNGDSEAILLEEVFKHLNISNINDYDAKNMKIHWTKLAKDLQEELNRKPTALFERWTHFMVPRLRYYEETERRNYFVYEWHLEITKIALENNRIVSLKDIDFRKIANEAKYISAQQTNIFFKKLDADTNERLNLDNEKSFREKLHDKYDHLMRRKNTSIGQKDFATLIDFYDVIRSKAKKLKDEPTTMFDMEG